MSTYFIVGASRGIGLALAQQLLETTKETVIVGVRTINANVEALLQKYDDTGRLTLVDIDINSNESVKHAAILVAESHPKGVDYLIVNAGIIPPDRSINITPEDFLDCLNTNVVGTFRVIQTFLPQVLKSQKKAVVGISSDFGSIGGDSGGAIYAYRASKSALNAVLVALSREYKKSGLITIPIHPGWVDTDMGRSGGETPPVKPSDSAKGILEVVNKVKLEDEVRLWTYEGKVLPW